MPKRKVIVRFSAFTLGCEFDLSNELLEQGNEKELRKWSNAQIIAMCTDKFAQQLTEFLLEATPTDKGNIVERLKMEIIRD